MSRGRKYPGRNKSYVNVMNEKDKEIIELLNKLQYERVKDDTSEDNKDEIKEEIDHSRIGQYVCV